MSGTKEGAKKMVQTNLKRYGKNHFKSIGQKGGKSANKKGVDDVRAQKKSN